MDGASPHTLPVCSSALGLVIKLKATVQPIPTKLAAGREGAPWPGLAWPFPIAHGPCPMPVLPSAPKDPRLVPPLFCELGYVLALRRIEVPVACLPRQGQSCSRSPSPGLADLFPALCKVFFGSSSEAFLCVSPNPVAELYWSA